MSKVQTGYTVRPIVTGLENLRRFAMIKRLRDLILVNEALTEIKGMGEEVYGGYVFDYGHLSVTLDAPFIASRDATPDELAQKFIEYVSLPLEQIEFLRDQITATTEKKVSTE